MPDTPGYPDRRPATRSRGLRSNFHSWFQPEHPHHAQATCQWNQCTECEYPAKSVFDCLRIGSASQSCGIGDHACDGGAVGMPIDRIAGAADAVIRDTAAAAASAQAMECTFVMPTPIPARATSAVSTQMTYLPA